MKVTDAKKHIRALAAAIERQASNDPDTALVYVEAISVLLDHCRKTETEAADRLAMLAADRVARGKLRAAAERAMAAVDVALANSSGERLLDALGKRKNPDDRGCAVRRENRCLFRP